MKKLVLLISVLACYCAAQAQVVTKIYQYKSGTYTDLETTDYQYKGAWYEANIRFGFEIQNGSTALPAGEKIIVKLNPFNDPDEYEYTLNAALGAGETVKLNELTTFAFGNYDNALRVIDDRTKEGTVCATVLSTTTLGDLSKGNNSDKCVTFKIINATAIDDATLSNVTIYPTMVSDNLNINNVENANISVYALNGQLINKVENANGNVSIDMSNCAAGMYMVKIQSDNNVRIEKIQVR